MSISEAIVATLVTTKIATISIRFKLYNRTVCSVIIVGEALKVTMQVFRQVGDVLRVDIDHLVPICNVIWHLAKLTLRALVEVGKLIKFLFSFV